MTEPELCGFVPGSSFCYLDTGHDGPHDTRPKTYSEEGTRMTWTVGNLSDRLRSLADKVASFDADDTAPRPLVDPLSDIERWADKHTNDERNRSCIDRIEDQARSNEETFQAMIDRTGDWAVDEGDEKRDLSEIFDESPLSVTRKSDDTLRVEESTGGPADGYTVTFDPSTGRVEDVEYYFQDWFDGAKLDIDERDYPATWQYLGHLADYAAEGLLEVAS